MKSMFLGMGVTIVEQRETKSRGHPSAEWPPSSRHIV